MTTNFIRAAVAIGLCIDVGVAIIALFFQQLLGPLFDLPLRDPALTTIAGGEYFVVALVYVLVLRDPQQYRVLLWLCAIDQAFAALLPALEIERGNVLATWKTIGPIPFNAMLALVYVFLAAAQGRAFQDLSKASARITCKAGVDDCALPSETTRTSL